MPSNSSFYILKTSVQSEIYPPHLCVANTLFSTKETWPAWN